VVDACPSAFWSPFVEILAQLLPLILIFGIFWFLLIRPQRNRQRQVMEMQRALQAGDEVMLTSGIYGTVTEIADDDVRVRVAEGVELKVARAAVGQVTPAERDEPTTETDADDDTTLSLDKAEPEEK